MCTDVMFYLLSYLLTTIQPSDDPSTISLTHNIECVSSSSSHGILSCLLTYVLVHLSRSTERPFFIGLALVKIKVVDVRDAKTVSIIQQTNKRTTLLTSGKQTLVTSTNIQRSTIAGKLQPLQQLQRHTYTLTISSPLPSPILHECLSCGFRLGLRCRRSFLRRK